MTAAHDIIDAQLIDDAAHVAFGAVALFADEQAVCSSCLITRSVVKSCFYAARNCQAPEEIQALANAIRDALIDGWGAAKEREAKLDGDEALSFDPASLVAYTEETLH